MAAEENDKENKDGCSRVGGNKQRRRKARRPHSPDRRSSWSGRHMLLVLRRTSRSHKREDPQIRNCHCLGTTLSYRSSSRCTEPGKIDAGAVAQTTQPGRVSLTRMHACMHVSQAVVPCSKAGRWRNLGEAAAAAMLNQSGSDDTHPIN